MGIVLPNDIEQIFTAGKKDQLTAGGFLDQYPACLKQSGAVVGGKRFVQQAGAGFVFIRNQVQDAEPYGEVKLILGSSAQLISRSQFAGFRFPRPNLEVRIDLDLFVPSGAEAYKAPLHSGIQLRGQNLLLMPGQFFDQQLSAPAA